MGVPRIRHDIDDPDRLRLRNRSEAARLLGCSVVTVDAMIQRRELAHVRIGKRVMTTLDDIDACIRRSRVEAK